MTFLAISLRECDDIYVIPYIETVIIIPYIEGMVVIHSQIDSKPAAQK